MIWATLEGRITFSNPDHRCSIETLFKELYDESAVVIDSTPTSADVFITYEQEGSDAYDTAVAFKKRVRAYDSKAKFYLTLTLRMP
jgi:replication-associated recombination protein RarA